jgi:enamine deaminase RidA (YjgF/YER057c/UK114 family)
MRLLSRSILYHQVKAACGGDLNKVKRVVKLVGFVNSNDDFIMQPKAVNGASDLMVEVFGEIGRHARTTLCQVSGSKGARSRFVARFFNRPELV